MKQNMKLAFSGVELEIAGTVPASIIQAVVEAQREIGKSLCEQLNVLAICIDQVQADLELSIRLKVDTNRLPGQIQRKLDLVPGLTSLGIIELSLDAQMSAQEWAMQISSIANVLSQIFPMFLV